MKNPDSEMTVFLVDDDDIVCESVSRSFRKQGVPLPIVTAFDGMEALEILRGLHQSKKITNPFVVLLDLNMPRMNGFEFLQEVRSDPNLAPIVIFVFTTSNDESDRTRAYRDNVAGYIVKSSVGPQFSRLTSLLDSYRKAVILPGLPSRRTST